MLVSPVRLWASAPTFAREVSESCPARSAKGGPPPHPVRRPLPPLASANKKDLYSRSGFGTFRGRKVPAKKVLVLAIEFWYFPPVYMVRQAPTSSREAEPKPAIPRRRAPWRFWPHVMLFAATVLLVNGLFGERGLVDTIRARRAYAIAARDLDRIKRDNEALRMSGRKQ